MALVMGQFRAYQSGTPDALALLQHLCANDMDVPVGRMELLDRWAGVQSSMALMPEWGRRLTGTVPRVHGNQVVSVSYSRLKPKQRLTSWLDILALSASYPDENWTGHAVARSKAGPQRALVGPLDHRVRR